MLLTDNLETRWNLFEHYAAKLIAQHPDFGFTQEEYNDFIYLKYYFGPYYLEKKLKPWLPSVFDKMRKQ
jgi:hypothetical protein